jgi:hypothetical protein
MNLSEAEERIFQKLRTPETKERILSEAEELIFLKAEERIFQKLRRDSFKSWGKNLSEAEESIFRKLRKESFQKLRS